MTSPSVRLLRLVLLAGFSASPVLAQVGPVASVPVEQPAFAAEALDEGALSKVAGREDTTQVATATQNAGVSRNSVGDNSTTGDARISDSAFQNLSGLSILNVNTGNNVAINAAMNVNISITPGP